MGEERPYCAALLWVDGDNPIDPAAIDQGVCAANGQLSQAEQVKRYQFLPQQYLYLLPLPQGQGSLRPTFWLDATHFPRRREPSKQAHHSISATASMMY